jgi:hypothetical protein
VVVNRVNPGVTAEMWAQVASLPTELKARVEQTLKENDTLARTDQAGIDRLRSVVGTTPIVLVPRFERDVHDLKALAETARCLWAEPG